MATSTLRDRLFERADNFGFDRETLAKHAGLSVDDVRKIENEDKALTSSTYERLCRALVVEPGAMYSGLEDESNRGSVRFRRTTRARELDAEGRRLLALASEQGRMLGELVEALGRDVELEEYRNLIEAKPPPKEEWVQGYGLGETAREQLVEHSKPIVELEELLMDWGIHVAYVDFASEWVTAASIWEPGAVPIILLNRHNSHIQYTGSRRASLAHELCHLLHDGDEQGLTTCVSSASEGEEDEHAGVQTTGDDSPVEKRARAFAPAFLAPPPWVEEWAEGLNHCETSELVDELAEHWGLSREAASWHAKNCDLLGDDIAEQQARLPQSVDLSEFERHSLQNDAHSASEKFDAFSEEIGPLWHGLPEKIVAEAHESELMTLNRARELLTWE